MKKLLMAGVAIATVTAMTSGANAAYVLAMKGPGAGNPFWAAVEEGAKAKGEELGVEVVVVAPPAETDVQAQITQVEDLLAQGIDGLAIAPTDPNALAPVIEAAREQGVPVVFVDTMGSNEGVTFIGTDNEAGAALAAQYMCDNIEEGADVAILQGVMSHSTAQLRANGAKAGLEACGLNVVAEQTAEWDRAKGLSVTENILAGNPSIMGIFGSNDNMALGAVEALKAAARDDVMVVGYDANPDAAAAVIAGDMAATVAQAPGNMGGFGIQALVDLKNGETIDPVIDTGTVLVTSENAAEYQ
ncbi:sugar ABC transporter substrate-binding protein [Devosia sp. RR2S18]|uniref:sugar ABC transporter substrate-binding protein n=1 Tax=Devosia rhizosphaerae TaxID=3049774 RepID=UPI002540692C|nr:sugar ABC transporter substrate-binding protein [Devosia sp. RR2S18]WIJ24260.1 sugar ABC transporter substrate-binding protein [Devosia sp. RR2S18]